MRITVSIALLLVVFAGCQKTDNPKVTGEPASTKSEVSDDVAIERAKLSPVDKVLVEAQEWCVINSDERLGSMGAPLKLEIKGQPVFVCCKGCKRRAEADPEKTLAKVAELKVKAELQKDSRK